jgi:hypothetical protein
MEHSGRGVAVLAAGALAWTACVTARDAVGGGDSRIDESGGREAVVSSRAKGECGPDAPGDVVLLDARTAGPVTCLPVTVSREAMSCPVGTECPSEVLFKGLTGPRGQLKLRAPVERSRLVAVADGFGPSMLSNATSAADRVLELELTPAEGFWLKALDSDGNYLVDVTLVFKQGGQTIAQLRSNALANVFFTQRQPFAGEPVTVEAEGFRPITISESTDLGEDGHTLTLQR